MTLLTTHNPIRPLPEATASELMAMFIDQDTDPLLVGACLALLAQREPAAHELAACAAAGGLSDTHIAPRMDEWEVVPRLAVATAMQAQAEGVARLTKTREELYTGAVERITQARAATEALVRAGVIRPMPDAG